MISLETIKDYIQGLSYKEVVRIITAYIFLYIFIIGFLLYKYFNAVVEIEQKTKLLNKARQDIQLILTEYKHIKSKQNDVDQLLAKDKNFYLQKYYQDIIGTIRISNPTASNLITQTWPNGYIEESLQLNLPHITMQQMCEFLQALQANSRVFVKTVDITKANNDKKINVNMAIATLKPAVEKTGK